MASEDKEEYTVAVETAFDYPFDDQYAKGWYVRETWYGPDTLVGRRFGPAITIRHPVTHAPIREEYLEAGQHHRYSGPAIIERDPESGRVTSTRFFEEGREVVPRNQVGLDASI